MRIILDMDDVLNNLSLDLLRFDGLDFKSYDDIGEWTWGYDIIGAVADLRQEDRMGIVEYWERIPRDLWANVSLSLEFNEILDFCVKAVGKSNILIATSPTKCSECLAGKHDWIIKNLPKWLHRQWSITPRKREYGRDSDAILIDDLPENCSEFKGLGGQAILVPRPWNPLVGRDIMSAIKKQWEDMCYATA